MTGRLTALVRLRVTAGLTLRDVARLCEVSPETVRLWETGQVEPGTRNGQRYAEVLGITQSRLNEILTELRAGRSGRQPVRRARKGSREAAAPLGGEGRR
jgi:transcriptional regulator with XRE-family HTH domain